MKRHVLLSLILCLFATPVLAGNGLMELDALEEESHWQKSARFYGGLRGGIAVPDGGNGVAPMAGVEMGVAVPSGFGFGLHVLSLMNSPDVPQFRIKETDWAIGALADLRLYLQTVQPLTLYGTLSAGFVGGPSRETRRNEVLPMVNPGFGGRIRLGGTYAAFEFGLASFQIPFVALCFGFEPDRKTPRPQLNPGA